MAFHIIIIQLIRFCALFKEFAYYMKDGKFRSQIWSIVVLLLFGGVLFREVENWTFLDSVYFSVITLTTVGYGDLSPQTSLGKILTICYILAGLGIMGSFIATISSKNEEKVKEIGKIEKTKAKKTEQKKSIFTKKI